MQKALITGGAGFVGSNLVNFLLEKDYDITVIDNLITGHKTNIEPFLERNNFKFIEGDLTKIDLQKELKEVDFDSIFHLASPASPIQYKKYPIETLMVNSLGTQKLLDYMQKTNSKKFVLASTSEVYGDPKIHPQTEDYWGNVNPNGIRSCYDESKRFAESMSMTYLRKYDLDVRIVRIFNTYGPNMEKNDGRIISNFITQALQNIPITIYGDGKQTRSFCFVSDLVNGLFQMSQKNVKGEVINLGNPNEKTIFEMANLIRELTKSNSEIVYEELPENADDPKKRQPNITKAKTLLNWEPDVKLNDGLNKTIDYFKHRFNL